MDKEQHGEDDDDAMFDDELVKRDLVLETKSKVTHLVHCPCFPDDKYEWWWVYMIEKNKYKTPRRLIAGPVQCTTLVDVETVRVYLSTAD